MTDKILTLHPEGKKGVNISLKKYTLIKDYILRTLEEEGTITYQYLNDKATKDLKANFSGSVPWYVVSVKLDLEAKRLIERIPKTSPHQIRLKKS